MQYLCGIERTATITMCVAVCWIAQTTLPSLSCSDRVIQSISDKGDIFSPLIWAALGGFNIMAAVSVARGPDRLAHRRRLGVMIDFL